MSAKTLDYVAQDDCPLCGDGGDEVARLRHGRYEFAGQRIAYPAQAGKRLPLNRCRTCSLVYKAFVPAPGELASLFQDEAAGVWKTLPYRFDNIRDLIRRWAPDAASFDLIDIGSADGRMLEFFDDRRGRRSALDVFFHPDCARRVKGEYVQGFIDGDLPWSGQPYGIALALDVFEHLYEPKRALDNLRRLVRPGGAVIVQTGNAEYPSSRRRGLGNWWYANLFDHHMFWSRTTFEFVANSGGWEIAALEETSHKEGPEMPLGKRVAVRGLKVLGTVPLVRAGMKAAFRRDVRLLAEPRALDHLNCVLRRT